MWFYSVGNKIDVYGRKGVIETQPKPYWYGVRFDTGELEEIPEGSIKLIPKPKPRRRTEVE